MSRVFENLLHETLEDEPLTRTREWANPHLAELVLWHREEGGSYREVGKLAGCSHTHARRIVRALEPDLG